MSRCGFTLFMLLIVFTVLSCSEQATNDELTDKWIGAWEYARYENKDLVSTGERKIQFSSDGTWEHSHNEYHGVFTVLDTRFTLERKDASGTSTSGSWTLDGNTLAHILFRSIRAPAAAAPAQFIKTALADGHNNNRNWEV